MHGILQVSKKDDHLEPSEGKVLSSCNTYFLMILGDFGNLSPVTKMIKKLGNRRMSGENAFSNETNVKSKF
jgi:hypothetical protein